MITRIVYLASCGLCLWLEQESAQKICLVTKGAIPGVYKSEADARAKNPGPIEIRLFKNLDELGEACRMHLLADNDNAGDSEDPSKTAKVMCIVQFYSLS